MITLDQLIGRTIVSCRVTKKLSDLTIFLAANFLSFFGVIGHEVLLPTFFILSPSPALFELTFCHLFLSLFQASLVEVALLFGFIPAKGIFSMEVITTIFDVLFDALSALAIDERLLVQPASTSGLVPLE